MKLSLILSILVTGVTALNAQILNTETISKHPVKQLSIDSLDYYFIEKGEGETIFFIHGFPDLANTWDETIDSLSSKYHCVAPFMRGYYPTGIPKNGDYSPKTIAWDIDSIAQKLGIEKYYVVGHDWGASVAYACMNMYPEKVIKGVTIAIPHPRTIKANFKTLYRARHFLKFRNETKSVKYTRKNNYKYIDVLYRRWAPGWKEYVETSKEVKKTFEQEGRLEAALGYYWTFHRNRGDKELSRFYGQIPTMPLLTFAGKQDGAIVIKQFYETEKIMKADFELVIDDNSGHFLHRESSALFIEKLTDFLGKK